MGTGASSQKPYQIGAVPAGKAGNDFTAFSEAPQATAVTQLVTGFMDTQVKLHVDGMTPQTSPSAGTGAKYRTGNGSTGASGGRREDNEDAEADTDAELLDRDQLSPYSMPPLHLALRTSSKSDDGSPSVHFLHRQGSNGMGGSGSIGVLGSSNKHLLLHQGSGNSDGTSASGKHKGLKSQKSLRSMALRSHSKQENTYISPTELIAQASYLHLSKTRAVTPTGSHSGSVGSDISGAHDAHGGGGGSHNNSNTSIGDAKQQITPKGSGKDLRLLQISPKVSSKDLIDGETKTESSEHVVGGGEGGVTASLMPASLMAGRGLTIITSQTPVTQGQGQGAPSAEPKPLPKRPQLKLQMSNGSMDDADWIQVSDDEGEDEDLKGVQRMSLSLLNPTAQQSYLLTKSGTIFVDGFTGGIGKGGINTAGGSASGLLPLQDRLVFLCRLGAGASGVVYKALDLRDMRLVALKMIPMFERGKRRQMVRELSALFQMLHQRNQILLDVDSPLGGERGEEYKGKRVEEKVQPGTESGDILYPSHLTTVGQQQRPSDYIVDFYDAFSNIDEGDVALMMEYMDGGSLQDIVTEGGCDNETTLASIAAQALVGLTFLHRCSQLHRDIKPGNFLISKRGFVKIADFGILRQMDEIAVKSGGTNSAGNVLDTVVESPTNRGMSPKNAKGADDLLMPRAQTFVGTATYMAPERIDGREYSYPSDIWSFGLALLTIALGKLPIDTQGGYWTILHHIRDCEPPQVPDAFSDEFRDFISQCLQKDPQERKSAIELLQHPFLLQAAAENDTEGDEGIGRAELADILSATAQHLEKRKQDSKKHPPTPVVGDNCPLPGTLAHTLTDIATSKTKDLMNKLFFPVKGTGKDQEMQNDKTLDFLAGQLHLSPELLKKEVRYFIDNLGDGEDAPVQTRTPPPQEYLATPKASHTRK